MDPDRTYRHFCMMARALEVIGERWSLLIVRDLYLGPRRFTDLVRGLADITPTRLTSRLRQLEAAGIVERTPAEGGREVWYALTEAGHALGPVLEALTLWGIEHARQPPLASEPVHATPVMLGTQVWLNRYASAAADGVLWAWRFPGDDGFTIRAEDGRWELARGKPDGAAVTVDATPQAWARFLTSPRESRRLPSEGVALMGAKADVQRFIKAFAARRAA